MSKAFAKILWKFHLLRFFFIFIATYRLMKSQWNDFPCKRTCKHLNSCVNKFLHQFQKTTMIEWMYGEYLRELYGFLFLFLFHECSVWGDEKKFYFMYQQLHRRMFKMIWQIYSQPWFENFIYLRFVGSFLFKCGWFYKCHLFWLGWNWKLWYKIYV